MDHYVNDWIPAPCCLSDKLADWQLLAEAGGDSLVMDKAVLDAGPSWGTDAFTLGWRARRYVALDSSAGVLAHLRRHMPNCVEVVEGDLTQKWPFDDASFDLVLDFSSFDDSIDAMAAYTQALRVLRPAGTLISSFANADVITDSSGGFLKQHPDALASDLHRMGFDVYKLVNKTQARAGVAARKR